MAATVQKGLYGMPELTPSEKLELCSRKLPKNHEVKKFDMKYVAEDFLAWLEATESAFENAGIEKDAIMVRKALDWMTPDTRDMIKGLSSIKIPNWEKFRKSLKSIFADEALEERSSRVRLETIVNKFNPISVESRQKMQIFIQLFSAEAEKQMHGVPLISNFDVIRLFLAPLDGKFCQLIQDKLQQTVSDTDIVI